MLEDAHSTSSKVQQESCMAWQPMGVFLGAFGASDLMCEETANARSRAASSIHLCMAAALALLRIVCLLIEPPLVLSCKERARLGRIFSQYESCGSIRVPRSASPGRSTKR